MGCGTSNAAHADLPPPGNVRPPPRAKLDLHLDSKSEAGYRSPRKVLIQFLSGKDGFIASAREAVASTSHTPAITPQAEAEPRGHRKSCRPRSLDHERIRPRDAASSSSPIPSDASERDRGEDVVAGREGEDKNATVGDGVRDATECVVRIDGQGQATEQGQELQQDKDQDQQQAPENSRAEKEGEAAAETSQWPPGPPILLVVHLFLENHRPKNVSALPGGSSCGGSCGDELPSARVHRVRFPGGLAYEGQLRREQDKDTESVPHGWGRLTFPGSAFYEGGWRCGVVHGKGALNLPNGNVYLGSWAYGRKHGLGAYIWADGSRHEGFYFAGERSGLGTMYYASGAVFEGEFEAGLRHGVGRLELAGGETSYDGDWEHGVPHGHGVFVDAAEGGERFEGSWRRGIRSGGGTLVQGWAKTEQERTDANANTGRGNAQVLPSEVAWYSGNFEDGVPHGDGMMKFCGDAFCGHVEKGVPNGGGRIEFGEHGSGGSFEARWRDGLPTGCGRWRCGQGGVEVDCTFEQAYSRRIWPS